VTTPRGPGAAARVLPIRDRSRLATATLRNSAGVSIELLENGSILAIRHGDILVNQVLGSPVEGGIGNVYLRRRSSGAIRSFPILGPAAPSRFRVSPDTAWWDGSGDDLDYVCTLSLAPEQATWFWTIRVRNASTELLDVDAVLSQDAGIGDEVAVRTNELYTSQYIDHTILEDETFGYLICSRQNLPQGDRFPWVMHGCLDGSGGFLTDGFQFYGLEYKATGVPRALALATLPNATYQHEFALPTLQSRPVSLPPGAEARIRFFGAFEADHAAPSGEEDLSKARAARDAYRTPAMPAVASPAPVPPTPRAAGLFDAPRLFGSRDLEPAELESYFGNPWRHVERADGKLLSFFHGGARHVVLPAKELVQERPTGHMMRSGRGLLPADDLLAVTAWMYGVFASQLTIGNTSFNKLLGVARNPLDALKASGLRIFVRTHRGQELLALPSAFEMGPTSARWIYHDERHTLSVSVAVSSDAPVCRLDVAVERGEALQLLLSHNVVVGDTEYESAPHVTVVPGQARVELRPGPGSLVGDRYPDATFRIVAPEPAKVDAIGGDELLNTDGVNRGAPYVVVKTKPITSFSLLLGGSVVDRAGAAESAPTRTADSRENAAMPLSGLARRLHLGGTSGRAAGELERLNDLLPWYWHDAVIHCSSPHGLEQYSGAAWGLRDVCQGPVEVLLATSNPEPVRGILRTVYEHQSRHTGDWPQWFMFDRYREIRAPDSHGDIIHWPIKAICDYVEATGDVSILDEEVPWTDEPSAQPTAETSTIFAHTERQVAKIEADFIPGTALVAFGGGDWEDTLQPADPAMARRLVSAWTVELAYQTLRRYATVCSRAGRSVMVDRLATLWERMRADFNRLLVPDGVVAGLAHFGDGELEYFLHPRDTTTGVSYRLLPMTRGMISELFDADQAARHAELVERHLTFPDGVRLMDRPMEYRGGTMRYFRRAESSACFGREVGLQYVHAHIRYIEAMAKIGRADEAWRALLAVCPIGLDADVPAALPRQSNAYFSSSDAAFSDRYEASRDWDRLRAGEVGVRGGWRIYSSGPGIYMNQLISNVLGLRGWYDDVVFDPVLPLRADGLTFDFEWEGRPVRYAYHVTGEGHGPSQVRVNGRALAATPADNPYRRGGLLVPKRTFRHALDRPDNVVDILV
jgi:cellobiose phosphorylase